MRRRIENVAPVDWQGGLGFAGKVESVKEINQMRAIMTKTERDEKHAIDITAAYLKEEKDIQIKQKRHLTKKEGQPPDYYFEIGDDKIGCEITNFDPIDQPVWKKGKNLLSESNIKYIIAKGVQRGLNEKGIPPLVWSVGFVTPPAKPSKNAEKIVDIITMMHNESIADSNEYKRNDPDKYYRLFIQNNISRIDILYIRPPDGANIDEKYHFQDGNAGFLKPITVEEMQDVITCKDKDIRNWKGCYDQKWLIITDYANIGFFTLKGAAKEAQYTCNFDKILYIQIGNRKQKWTGSLTDTYTVYELKAE